MLVFWGAGTPHSKPPCGLADECVRCDHVSRGSSGTAEANPILDRRRHGLDQGTEEEKEEEGGRRRG